MLLRRIYFILLLLFLTFLILITLDQRTGYLNRFCAEIGLEFTGNVMQVFSSIKKDTIDFWEEYINLRNVKKQNTVLKEENNKLRRLLMDNEENNAELKRLRQLLKITYQPEWPMTASRVLAWRIGPNSPINTMMISNGYLTGASTGTPVTSWQGVVGRIYKAAPTTSLVLLLTDTGSRISVLTSESRIQGILAGCGAGVPMEVRFVRQNSPIKVGEYLVSSGLDAVFPKGIPVAKITAISTGSTSRSAASVLEIQAEPLVDFNQLEEVYLLQRPTQAAIPENDIIYTRRTPNFEYSNNIDSTSKEVAP